MYIYEWLILVGILVFISVVCLIPIPTKGMYHGDDEEYDEEEYEEQNHY